MRISKVLITELIILMNLIWLWNMTSWEFWLEDREILFKSLKCSFILFSQSKIVTNCNYEWYQCFIYIFAMIELITLDYKEF